MSLILYAETATTVELRFAIDMPIFKMIRERSINSSIDDVYLSYRRYGYNEYMYSY
jgi:hypothetical protein